MAEKKKHNRASSPSTQCHIRSAHRKQRLRLARPDILVESTVQIFRLRCSANLTTLPKSLHQLAFPICLIWCSMWTKKLCPIQTRLCIRALMVILRGITAPHCFLKLLWSPWEILYIFKKKHRVLFLLRMFWLFGFFGNVKWEGHKSQEVTNLARSHKEYRAVLLIIYRIWKKASMKHPGCAILDGMPDHLLSTLSMHEAPGMRLEYHGMKVKELYQLVISRFLGKEALIAEKTLTLEPYL